MVTSDRMAHVYAINTGQIQLPNLQSIGFMGTTCPAVQWCKMDDSVELIFLRCVREGALQLFCVSMVFHVVDGSHVCLQG